MKLAKGEEDAWNRNVKISTKFAIININKDCQQL